MGSSDNPVMGASHEYHYDSGIGEHQPISTMHTRLNLPQCPLPVATW